MRTLKPLELGLMFWATESADASIRLVRQFGLSAGQLGISAELPLNGAAERWQSALVSNPDFVLVTAVCSYAGEDYADIPTVQRTVGLLPENTREERVRRTKEVADLAARLGIPSVGCHIGFVPEDQQSREYVAIRDVVRDLCDTMGQHGQSFALETGQETAHALLQFIADVGRPNLKINFDPANMLLYGTGDPIEAARLLGEHIVSVHCKDGDVPDANVPGALGVERPLGAGRVNFPRFLAALKEIGYRGILSIERETNDAQQRTADIQHAVEFLRALV